MAEECQLYRPNFPSRQLAIIITHLGECIHHCPPTIPSLEVTWWEIPPPLLTTRVNTNWKSLSHVQGSVFITALPRFQVLRLHGGKYLHPSLHQGQHPNMDHTTVLIGYLSSNNPVRWSFHLQFTFYLCHKSVYQVDTTCNRTMYIIPFHIRCLDLP